MNNDLISREALALDVRRNLMPNVDADGTVSVEDAERYFLSRIETASAVDAVEEVHSRWELVATKWMPPQLVRVGYCQNCNEERPVDNYCPNCGAKMDGE